MRRAVVVGTGAALPERIVTNHELAQKIDTSHDWIVERTGIEQRHIAAEGEFTSHLAIKAAKQALANSNINAADIDMIILATTTPDETMPATATKIQAGLGATKAAAFDINAACSGFVYAMTVANSLIMSSAANRILLIGAETYSRILDWNDRGTCILFGDGAAAMVLEAQDGERGVLYSGIGSDGQVELLGVNGGVSSTQTAGYLFMAGKEIYRNAVTRMPEAVLAGLKALDLPVDAIDWLVPHQANLRIIHGVGHKLKIGDDRVIATVQHHANTSAASIPLALHIASTDGRIKKGQLVACPALGAGLTWGCSIIRW